MKDFLELTDKERIALYSKHTPEMFWDFINPTNEVMELRPKHPDKTEQDKHINNIYNLLRAKKMPAEGIHFTGVFITTKEQYKYACAYCVRNKLTLYYGLNPKKQSYHQNTRSTPKLSYNGTKLSEKGFKNLCFDFDPSKDVEWEVGLAESYKMARKFLEDKPNIKRYMLGCSGRGVQLIVPMDNMLVLPRVEYDENKKAIMNREFNVMTALPKRACQHLKATYSNDSVSLDTVVFSVARVARAFPSLNLKEGKVRYAGIIEIKDDGINKGMYEHIMGFKDQVEHEEEIKEKFKDKKLQAEFTCTKETIKDSSLAKLLLKKNLPEGGRHTTLFFQFQILAQANGIDTNEPEVRELIEKMRLAQNEPFPIGDVTGITFNPEAITNWCVEFGIKPIYPLMYNRNKNRTLPQEWFDTFEDKYKEDKTHLPENGRIKNRIVMFLNQQDIKWELDYEVNKIIQWCYRKIHNQFGADYLAYIIKYNIVKDLMEKIDG